MNICPNCGKHLEENETVCSNCGVSINEEDNNKQFETMEIPIANDPNKPYQPKRFVSKQNYGPNIFHDDDEEFYLLDVYISQNIPKLKTGFSFNAFFFSALYMFYRKMWALGIFTMIFYALASYFIPNTTILLIVIFVYNIIMGGVFKDMYLKKALGVIDDVKKQNPNKTDEELVPIIKEKGGTSAVVLLISLVATIIFAIVNGLVIVATLKSAGQTTLDFLKERIEKTKHTANQIDDLIRNNKEINIAGDLYVVFPAGYSRVRTDNDQDLIFNNKQNCKVTVLTEKAEDYSNSTDAYMDIKIKTDTKNEELEYKNANYYNHPWRYAITDNPRSMIFTTVHNGILYDITIDTEENNSVCVLTAETIAATFKFK